MNLSEFDYELPQSFIAQEPLEPRDSSKLMRLDRQSGAIAHSTFRHIVDFINPGDVLVMNTTRVIPARIFATKAKSGGKIEILLLRQLDDTRWHVLAGGRKVVPGLELHFAGTDVIATVLEALEGSQRIINFSQPVNALLT